VNCILWCWHELDCVLRLLHAKSFRLVTFGNFRTPGTVSHSVPGPRTCTGVYWIYRYHDVTNDETIRFVRRIRQTVRGIYYLLEVVVRQGSASRWRFENSWRPQLRCFIKWPERHVDISRCWCVPCRRFRRASATSCLNFLFVLLNTTVMFTIIDRTSSLRHLIVRTVFWLARYSRCVTPFAVDVFGFAEFSINDRMPRTAHYRIRCSILPSTWREKYSYWYVCFHAENWKLWTLTVAPISGRVQFLRVKSLYMSWTQVVHY